MTNTIDADAAAKRLYEMNGFALYGRSLGDWEDGDSEIGRSHYERLRWVTQVRHLAEAVGMSLRFDNCCGPGEGCTADNCTGRTRVEHEAPGNEGSPSATEGGDQS